MNCSKIPHSLTKLILSNVTPQMLSKDVSIIDVTFIVSLSVLLALSPIHVDRKTIIEYISVLIQTIT